MLILNGINNINKLYGKPAKKEPLTPSFSNLVKRSKSKGKPKPRLNQVCVIGANEKGQLGCEGGKFEVRPRFLHFHVVIKSIACGLKHSHLLSDKG